VYPHQKIHAKHLWSDIWAFVQGSGVLLGCLIAVAIVACGRAFLPVTTSTLSGWSALFFFSLFTGIAVANLRSDIPFAGATQTLGLLAGCLASVTALISLQYQYETLSDILLGVSAFLLLPTLLSIRPGTPIKEQINESVFGNLALGIDNLMKYELPQDLKTKLSELINMLWRSPPNKDDYIPVQNEQVEHGVKQLEDFVKTRNFIQSTQTVDHLIKCLEERNQILNNITEIQYRKLNPSMLMSNNQNPEP
jgi:hypothetical protein